MADVGRPPLFKTPEELILAVENYFTWLQGDFEEQEQKTTDKEGNTTTQKVKVCTRSPQPATITGLALHLGFESRQSVYDYETHGEYSYIIKNARLRVENSYERNLYSDKPVGSIFALKNMGWRDKTETELSGGLEIKQITGLEVK